MRPHDEHWEEILERYHDGELGLRARRKVARHLETCQRCQAYLDGLDSLGELLVAASAQAQAGVPFDSLWDRVSARLEQEPEPSLVERILDWLGEFWYANRKVALAGAVAAGVTLAITVPFLARRGGRVDSPRVEVSKVIVDSLSSGKHDMVLVNVHPDDMTTVIWLLEDEDTPGDQGSDQDGAVPRSPQAQPPSPGTEEDRSDAQTHR